MSTATLLTKIKALPPELRQEVEDSVAFLRTEKRQQTPITEREFGYAQGKE